MAKKKKTTPKIFVLDTNIILHDYNAVKQFQDNDIVIPIAVIEELDKFKKGNDALSFNARAFMREINKLTDGRDFEERGVPLGKRLGYIKIEPNHPFCPELQNLTRPFACPSSSAQKRSRSRARSPGSAPRRPLPAIRTAP